MEQIDTEKLVKEVFEDSADLIKKELKKKLIDDISYSLYYSAKDGLQSQVQEFFETEMKGDIDKLLKESKSDILDKMKDGFVKVGAQLSCAMCEKALKNLEVGSYQSGEIMKKIFN